ncbi:MAG: cell division protein FtsW [Parcubacteria group bacterium]|nr:cell division protein FtsW [Parcubacteria group bacterium]
MPRKRTFDTWFLLIVTFVTLGGFFVFVSASLGLYGREGAEFGSVVFNQFLLGLVGGAIGLYAGIRIPYKAWRKYALPISIFAFIIMLLVFVPHIGFEHGGAKRWIHLGFTTFQPAEILKFAVVVYLAAWLSSVRRRIGKVQWSVLPFLVILSITGALLLSQPDTGTFIVISGAAGSMLLVAGAKWKHVIGCLLIGVIVLGGVFALRPYARERVVSYFQPGDDVLGSDWQINQSLIAIGSGGMVGRGFGQSVQKFSYLPEPIGDSIFAVASEEFGFVGGMLIIIGFMIFLYRGLYIAQRAPDMFSLLLVSGIVIMVVWQSFVNIGAMLKVFPLTGLPLLFISHGGTALAVTLTQMGIVLNVSKHMKKG